MSRGTVGLFVIASFLGGVTLLAQTPEPATASPQPSATPKEGKKPAWLVGRPNENAPSGPAFENVRKAIEALTPEQRERFRQNLLRWANLSPEEKKALRDKEELRKKVVEDETNAALQESGLQLDSDRRDQFVKRYGEGRRQIEEQLRKEAAEKRKPMIRDLISRLRTEFASESAAPVAPVAPSQTIQTESIAPAKQ